jgi:exosortase
LSDETRFARNQQAPSRPPAGAVSTHQLTYSLAGFAALCLLPSLLVLQAMRNLVTFILEDQSFTHIPLIPIVAIFLIYTSRDLVFKTISRAWLAGGALALLGIAFLVLARIDAFQLASSNQISLLMLGFVFLWIGAFLLFFGLKSFRVALFPLLFLFFIIPIPEPLLSNIIYLLQQGSSKAAEWMFQLMGVPFFRQGFNFALPGVTIRVAEECSGIRSTLSLVILAVLAAQLFLKNPVNRLILCLITIPISIVKNGFRIAVLSTLAIYVDPSFLTGPLHHHGGVVFYLLGLLPMFLVFKVLQRLERNDARLRLRVSASRVG